MQTVCTTSSTGTLSQVPLLCSALGIDPGGPSLRPSLTTGAYLVPARRDKTSPLPQVQTCHQCAAGDRGLAGNRHHPMCRSVPSAAVTPGTQQEPAASRVRLSRTHLSVMGYGRVRMPPEKMMAMRNGGCVHCGVLSCSRCTRIGVQARHRTTAVLSSRVSALRGCLRYLCFWVSSFLCCGPGGAIRTLTLFFFYYGIHSLMFGGYPSTAIGYPPTAIGYPPTAIGYPPAAIGYPPTAIGYPPAAIVGRIGHSEFFFFHYGTPCCGLPTRTIVMWFGRLAHPWRSLGPPPPAPCSPL